MQRSSELRLCSYRYQVEAGTALTDNLTESYHNLIKMILQHKVNWTRAIQLELTFAEHDSCMQKPFAVAPAVTAEMKEKAAKIFCAGHAAMADKLKRTRRIPGLNDGDKWIMPTWHLFLALRNAPYKCITVADMLQRIIKDKMVDTFIKVVTEPEFCYSGNPPGGGFLQKRAHGRTVLDEIKDWHDSFVVLSEHPTDMSTKLKHALCDLGITRQCSCRDYRHYMCCAHVLAMQMFECGGVPDRELSQVRITPVLQRGGQPTDSSGKKKK